MKIIKFLIIAVLAWGVSCSSGGGDQSTVPGVPGSGSVLVKEVKDASSYTYVFGTSDGKDIWLAAPQSDIKVGETYFFKGSMEMKNFESKDLQRTFESIYFVESLMTEEQMKTPVNPMGNAHGNTKTQVQTEINIEKAEGGITIGELFKNRKDYADKTVKIRGQVVKFNAEIMNKNWLHIQDGTSDDEDFDLTVTTSDFVKVGDTVTVEGVIFLEKDFGMGYSYEVLMEQAVIQK